jgi:hypothetical protein
MNFGGGAARLIGSAADRSRGAYGFRLAGVPGAQPLLVDAPPHWPHLKLEVRVTSSEVPAGEYVNEASAILRPRSGGWIKIDRPAGRATFSLPKRPNDGALVHPHLASVAVVFAHWLGRESFHAGGFVVRGRVWGVLGDRKAGKSSFLASLALAGIPVLSDDVLVLDEATAFAGPRSIDLRTDAARHLGVGEPLGMMGTRERWRLGLASVDPELPFGGWVSLCWADRAEVCRLRGADRLRVLGAHRASSLYPSSPAGLIDLSSLPFLQLCRPRCWQLVEETVHRLLDALD